MSSQFTRSIKHFSSLHACVEHLREHYDPLKTVRITKTDINSGERDEINAPAFLYRGESYPYPTTPSFLHRVQTDPELSTHVKDGIEKVARCIDKELQDMLTLEPMLSEGFLQHYGIPTRLLDVTSSLDVAAYFASGGKAGDKGAICVFPLDVASQNSTVIDLRQHPKAPRARRQSAFALWNKEHTDMKSPTCIQQLQLKWFSFDLQDTDRSTYHATDDLMDARIDHVAGMIQFLLDNMPKMDKGVAKCLSKWVIPAPFVAKILDWYGPGQPKTVELTSLSEAALQYDVQAERQKNYERWSDRCDQGV